MNKNVILVIIMILIVGAIGYLEVAKERGSQSNNEQIQQIASTTQNRLMNIKEKAKKYPSAVEIMPGGQFINSGPFTLKSLIGKKVILVDFWTYTCINCQRTTPYLNAWYSKYEDQGFVIVGVHSPEFEFEKDYDNVLKAVQKAGIKYPVVQDNDFSTWRAYGNRFWPHKYLIDIDGYIIYDHIGEGAYKETEKIIQGALKERSLVLELKDSVDTDIANPSNVINVDSSKVQSPETYFGFFRNEYLGNGKKSAPGDQTLSFPNNPSINTLYLDGVWNFQNEFAENKSAGAKIKFIYNAKNIYFVASSSEGTTIKIFQDGKLFKETSIKEYALYTLIQGTDYGQHTLDIEIDNPGLKAFTFTFG